MMCSVLTLTIRNNQGIGEVGNGKMYDIYFPLAHHKPFVLVTPRCKAA